MLPISAGVCLDKDPCRVSAYVINCAPVVNKKSHVKKILFCELWMSINRVSINLCKRWWEHMTLSVRVTSASFMTGKQA